jgi:hypothetical protein
MILLQVRNVSDTTSLPQRYISKHEDLNNKGDCIENAHNLQNDFNLVDLSDISF